MHHLINLIINPDSSTYEMLMLVCFGASWPVAVLKTYQTKSSKGKSFLFLLLILLGYIFGIIYKVTTNFDFVIWLYVANAALVLADMTLWFMYKDNN
jgi:hypothetical protein